MFKALLASVLVSLFFNFQTHAETTRVAQVERPPQFVLISFDGSYSDQFWKESFNLADKANARFSYFVSGVYFIEHNDNHLYQGPDHKLGASDIGFGDNNLADISTRTENVWEALRRKFDIGSHVNGHFDGSTWSEDQWVSEFTQFHRFVEKVFSVYAGINESFSPQWDQTLSTEIKGFRAPLLAESAGTAGALEKFKYLYDSSKVLSNEWPYQMKDGIWNIGLSQITLAGTKRHTIAMDYNLLYGQCQAKFNPKDGGECADLTPEILARDEDQTYQSYIDQFIKSYYGNRAPISIGHHFSLFNRGIYWKALQKFTYAVCNQPEVKCITHSEMVRWLEDQKQSRGPSYLTALNKGEFKSESEAPTSVRATLAPVMSVIAAASLVAKSKAAFDLEFYAQDIFAEAVNHPVEDWAPVDDIEAQMLRGDLPEAHLHERDAMDFDSNRYTPPAQ